MLHIFKYSCVAVSLAVLGLSSTSFAQADSTGSVCRAELSSLTAEWDGIGFAAPSKPGQQVVTGRGGQTTTGGEFNYITSQMRSAQAECQRGEGQAAMQRISTVHRLLAHSMKPAG